MSDFYITKDGADWNYVFGQVSFYRLRNHCCSTYSPPLLARHR